MHFSPSLFHILIIFTISLVSYAYEMRDTGLCAIEGDSTGCTTACRMLDYGDNGICVDDSCYCTDLDEGADACEDDDHEKCDAVCQRMAPSNFVGFCMDGQCSCLS
ncbi:hypothetical protein BX666DRAFT_2023502 [Dichotomocladium elegans]|nr:hypothetical protein BX666DRAFT_2023502 [Dichotomocladium elegans]